MIPCTFRGSLPKPLLAAPVSDIPSTVVVDLSQVLRAVLDIGRGRDASRRVLGIREDRTFGVNVPI